VRKILVVAAREYRSSVRTKSFVVAIVLMPIFMFGGIGLQKFLADRGDTDIKTAAVVDYSGRLSDVLVKAAVEYNEQEAIDPATGRQMKSKIFIETVTAPTDGTDRLRLELSDRVRSKNIFAFIEITPGIMDAKIRSDEADINYYSNEPTYRDIERWLSRVVNDKVRSVRLADAGIDRRLVDKAMIPVQVESLGLMTKTASGEVKQAERVNKATVFLVPFAVVMLMWVALMMTTQPLLQGVIEEKMQKISEVLLGSLRPFELMTGKLLGSVGVAITLVVIYMGGAFVYFRQSGHLDMVPFHLLGWFFLFQTLAILMFGALFLAVGSCCSDMREAQSLVMPIWIVLVIPMMALGAILQQPSSSFATWLSLFPPATPMVMMMRMTIPPGVPWWQPPIGIAGTLLTTIICIWAAGRIFRVGLLLQGKAPKISDLVRFAIKG
jgi:ABC-2 type transport system permease protein